ncbi:MAG: hypothetical protein KGO94_04795 [Alphaproteobacteria bacterium]|nr:hypothetical protein [Alphaproteobacteria bacterium]
MTQFVFIGFALVLLASGIAQLRALRKRSAARARYFNAVTPMFEHVMLRLEPSGFPRLTAQRDGHAFDLRAVQDSLTYRKLPVLWVMISLPEALPVKATLDVMTRATGQESFSNYATLHHSLSCPDFLPEGTGVRSDDAANIIPLVLLERHANLFDDVRIKEVLISPKGIRIVILGEEAERGQYLLFRDAEVGRKPLAAARLQSMLDAILAIRHDVMSQQGPDR